MEVSSELTCWHRTHPHGSPTSMRGFSQSTCERQEGSLDVNTQWGSQRGGRASPRASSHLPGAQGQGAPVGILLSAGPCAGADFEKEVCHLCRGLESVTFKRSLPTQTWFYEQDLRRPEAVEWKTIILRLNPSHPLWSRQIKPTWRIKRHLLTEIFD